MCLTNQGDELGKHEAGETWSRLTVSRSNDNKDQNTTEMHVIWTYIYLKTSFEYTPSEFLMDIQIWRTYHFEKEKKKHELKANFY